MSYVRSYKNALDSQAVFQKGEQKHFFNAFE